MTNDEMADVVIVVAENPLAGAPIEGSGSCRKLRIAGRGKGKSGGYRVITFYSGPDIPLFLLTVFSKGERANLDRAECNKLKGLTKLLLESYATKRARR